MRPDVALSAGESLPVESLRQLLACWTEPSTCQAGTGAQTCKYFDLRRYKFLYRSMPSPYISHTKRYSSRLQQFEHRPARKLVRRTVIVGLVDVRCPTANTLSNEADPRFSHIVSLYGVI